MHTCRTKCGDSLAVTCDWYKESRKGRAHSAADCIGYKSLWPYKRTQGAIGPIKCSVVWYRSEPFGHTLSKSVTCTDIHTHTHAHIEACC